MSGATHAMDASLAAGMSRDIPPALIDPDPDQPRKHFDEAALNELARSMAESGLAVSILVRPVGERFVIVHGERRWRAACALGWETIPATVRDLDIDTARWLSLVENIQRSDLTPIEEAFAFKARLDHGMTQSELGLRLGKSQSYVAQKLRLLNLPSPLASYLETGALSERHIRTVLRLRNLYRGGELGEDPEREIPFDLPDDCLFDYVDVPERMPENQPAVVDFMDRNFVVGFFASIRPLEHSGVWVGVDRSHDMQSALATGCKAFIRWAVKERRVPSWVVTAYWFASGAVQDRLSVATLTLAIDRWRESLYGAVIVAAALRKGSEPPADPLANMEWWGCRADLRHAGLDPKALPGDLVLRASEWLEAGADPPLPSMLQPWGFAHDRYQELIAAREGALA